MVGEGNHNLYGVLQNSMDVVEGETGNSSGTGVTCDDGTEEVDAKQKSILQKLDWEVWIGCVRFMTGIPGRLL